LNRPIEIDPRQGKIVQQPADSDPKLRPVRGPVGWLLGPELIGQLTKILRRRSDPRDWMPYYRGCAHDEFWKRDGSLTRVSTAGDGLENGVLEVAEDAPPPKRGAERLMGVAEPTAAQAADASSEIWFDYLSDAGDAVDSMYAVAYATMVSFEGDADPTTWSRGQAAKPLTVAEAGAEATLPRGQFVFFGGDIAYHVSDAATLRVRVQEPFNWAFHDAQADGFIAASAKADLRHRRIYGIPGNHDWYDNIEGFSLVFRLGSGSANAEDKSMVPIPLPELERVQLASYVAIQLPFGWQLWGLDIDGGLDSRQRAYFESLASERLIVATASPALAFGASIATEGHRKAAEALKVPIPKVPLSGNTTSPAIRLDVSGDIHHYARYYPREAGGTYGSVVSGLGGAFHHPSFTRASSTDERVEPVRLYPSDQDSRVAIADNMLHWESTWFGSWARVVPFTLTLVLGFAATYSVGGAWLLEGILSLLPGFPATATLGGAYHHGVSWLLLGAIALAGWGIRTAIKFGVTVYREQLANPGLAANVLDLLRNGGYRRVLSPYRSYMYCWVIGLLTIAPLALAPLWLPPSLSRGLDLATLVILFGFPIGGAIAGWKVAAHYLATPMKLLLAGVGIVHALVQVLSCVLFARLFTLNWVTGAAGVFAIVVASLGVYLARPLYKAESKLHTWLLALMPLVVFATAMGPLIAFAQGVGVERCAESWAWDLVRFVVSGAFCMPLGTTWFVWYLAVTSRLDAHNNEAGGTARVTDYRQFIRFNLRADGLTGYVIAIRDSNESSPVREGGKNLRFSLVDVFTLTTPPMPPQVPGTALVGDSGG